MDVRSLTFAARLIEGDQETLIDNYHRVKQRFGIDTAVFSVREMLIGKITDQAVLADVVESYEKNTRSGLYPPECSAVARLNSTPLLARVVASAEPSVDLRDAKYCWAMGSYAAARLETLAAA